MNNITSKYINTSNQENPNLILKGKEAAYIIVLLQEVIKSF